jgi:hypothetical protein
MITRQISHREAPGIQMLCRRAEVEGEDEEDRLVAGNCMRDGGRRFQNTNDEVRCICCSSLHPLPSRSKESWSSRQHQSLTLILHAHLLLTFVVLFLPRSTTATPHSKSVQLQGLHISTCSDDIAVQRHQHHVLMFYKWAQVHLSSFSGKYHGWQYCPIAACANAQWELLFLGLHCRSGTWIFINISKCHCLICTCSLYYYLSWCWYTQYCRWHVNWNSATGI